MWLIILIIMQLSLHYNSEVWGELVFILKMHIFQRVKLVSDK